MEILKGHISPETALEIPDYPFGFRLRCKIRYWLEYKSKKGFRFCSQTTNPKRIGEHWNAVKSSTYSRYGGVMLRNPENGHICWKGLSEYDELPIDESFLSQYGDTMPDEAVKELQLLIVTRRRYEELKNEGVPWQLAGKQASFEAITGKLAF
jgi:hypothetical protein